MEFNIEYGGTGVDFQGVVRAIKKSDADVVGIEEGYGRMPRLARSLGWRYYDPRMQIMSRLPLLSPADGDGLFTFVALRPGQVVAMGNVHLPSSPYGPFRIRDGKGPAAVLAMERRVRLPAIQPTIEALSGLASKGMPTFVVGDFNAPSHLDWTKATVGARDHLKFPLDWPVSEAMEHAGFNDSYRAVHPDPVKDPGLTWPAARPFVKGYNPGLNGAAADRIDFIFAAGEARATSSEVVGERHAPGVSLTASPWPSDHRAVVSTFRVRPADPPVFVAVDDRLVTMGDSARVVFHDPAREAGRILVRRMGDGSGNPVVQRSTGGGSPANGSLNFSTAGWAPGAYEASLVARSGRELTTTQFWVELPGQKPEIHTAKRSYEAGDAIDIKWEWAPGNRWDWVGIYRRGANPNVAYYLTWAYTKSSIEGSTELDEDANGRWPLPAGKYSVYLLEDDSYKKLAGGPFTVRTR